MEVNRILSVFLYSSKAENVTEEVGITCERFSLNPQSGAILPYSLTKHRFFRPTLFPMNKQTEKGPFSGEVS